MKRCTIYKEAIARENVCSYTCLNIHSKRRRWGIREKIQKLRNIKFWRRYIYIYIYCIIYRRGVWLYIYIIKASFSQIVPLKGELIGFGRVEKWPIFARIEFKVTKVWPRINTVYKSSLSTSISRVDLKIDGRDGCERLAFINQFMFYISLSISRFKIFLIYFKYKPYSFRELYIGQRCARRATQIIEIEL